MKYFVAILALIGAFVIQMVSADLKEIECKGQKYQLDEEHQNSIKQCLSSVGISSVKDLGPQNAGCFSKCTMVQKGLIDDAGKPHKEKIMNMVDTHVPESIRGEWKAAIEKCLDSEGSKVDMKDEKCVSFLPLTLCVHKAFMTICKS